MKDQPGWCGSKSTWSWCCSFRSGSEIELLSPYASLGPKGARARPQPPVCEQRLEDQEEANDLDPGTIPYSRHSSHWGHVSDSSSLHDFGFCSRVLTLPVCYLRVLPGDKRRFFIHKDKPGAPIWLLTSRLIILTNAASSGDEPSTPGDPSHQPFIT